MIPVGRRCLMCSGQLPLPLTVGPSSLVRRRSAVPVPATDDSPAAPGSESTLAESRAMPSGCPFSVRQSKVPGASHLENVKTYEEVPGPKGLPFLGSLLDYKPVGNGPYDLKKLHLATIDRFREFGPIYKETMAGSTHVHIINPNDVKDVIQHEGATPRRINLEPIISYRKLRKRNTGMGNIHGEEWKRLRQPFNQLLLKPEKMNTYLPKTERCAEDLVTLIRNLRTSDGDVPEFGRQVERWVLETIGSVALDSRIGCMEKHPSPLAEQAITSMVQFISTLGDLMYGIPLYKLGIYNDSWKRFAAAQDFLFEFMLSHVIKTIENMNQDAHTVSGSHPRMREATFIESLLATHPTSSPEDISDLLNDLLLSAMDTTASMFSFLIYNLSKNPECQEKIHEEISRVLSPGEPITPEILQMTPYLKACVKETSRLHPTIDGTSRVLDRDITLSGYNIPANTIIRIHVIAGLMSEYVPEPDKFQPERWLRAADRSIMINPFLIPAFGVGCRGCVGRRLAEQQMYVGVIKLLQNFRLEWHHEDVSMDVVITSRPSRPVQPTILDRT